MHCSESAETVLNVSITKKTNNRNCRFTIRHNKDVKVTIIFKWFICYSY